MYGVCVSGMGRNASQAPTATLVCEISRKLVNEKH
jgi:hypothetical protein